MTTENGYGAAYEAGRADLFKQLVDYAAKCKAEEAPKGTIVTVLWNDCYSDGMSDYNYQEITIFMRAPPHIDSMVSMAMRAQGYDQEMINEALVKSYGLVGIIIGKVTWLM